MLYFAYGSNLDEENWSDWCTNRGHDPSSIVPIGPAWLPDHEPVFHYQSRLRQGGALDVQPRFGATTPGALFKVYDWAGLDAKEGARGGYYRRESVTVLTDDGHAHAAITYRVCEARITPHIAPTEAYYELCARGLSRFGHGTEHLRSAAADEPVPQVVDDVFVYGTLMYEQSRHDLMVGHGGFADAEVQGAQLHRIDWYPGIVPGAGAVFGETYRYDNVTTILRTLDEYEDFKGYDADKSLYRRSLMRARKKDGTTLAWAYVYLGEVNASTLIETGDWKAAQSS